MQEVRNDGSVGPIVPFNAKELYECLEKENVKEVKVFRLKKGMVITIGGHAYKVTAVREDGKVVLKPKVGDRL